MQHMHVMSTMDACSIMLAATCSDCALKAAQHRLVCQMAGWPQPVMMNSKPLMMNDSLNGQLGATSLYPCSTWFATPPPSFILRVTITCTCQPLCTVASRPGCIPTLPAWAGRIATRPAINKSAALASALLVSWDSLCKAASTTSSCSP